MKIKVILSVLILFAGVGGAFAQEVEQDDMYFNSKDRAKLRAAQKTSEVAYASAKKSRNTEAPAEESFNPTDSYSARNVNPEYTSRSHSQTAKADDEDYFVSNYQYNQQSKYNNWNNSFNNWYGNSWYAPNYWGSGINSWNSPYYGSYYDSWGSPWANPYYQSGWSSSFSYYWGNSWNYGWNTGMGMGMGFGNPYYNSWNPYYGYASYWNSPFYNNWGWGGGGYGYYPGRVIVVESGNRVNHSYGKRPVRESSISTNRSNDSRSRSGVVGTPARGDVSNGRVSNSGRTQNEYYNRSWRNSGSDYSAPRPTYDSRSSTQNNRSSSWNSNDSNSSWGNRSSDYSAPSRSNSSFGSGSTPTRSHSSSSGSGSNGRSRGRD